MARGYSTVSHTQKRKRDASVNEDEQVELLGPSIRDRPITILMKILLKLSVKETVFCKSVCKDWYRLISDTKYAKLHLSRAKPYTLVRALNSQHVSRTLHFVEMPVVDCRDSKCENVRLSSKVKIPMCNAEKVLNGGVDCGSDVRLKGKRVTKVKPKEHKLNMVNSCNGFICLSEPSCNDPVTVCNPVTGEFIDLPKAKTADMSSRGTVDCGFGYDPNTNEYKVIRMYGTSTSDERMRCIFTGEMYYCTRITEILSLGSGSWKNIGHAPPSLDKLSFPTYLNGTIYWLLFTWSRSLQVFIASFDFTTERFKSVPLPGQHRGGHDFGSNQKDNISLGSLKGCLCLCDSSSCESLDIWVMKQDGVKLFWREVYSIDIFSSEPCLPMGLYQPLHHPTNGALLLFHPRKNALIYYDKKRWVSKYFKIQGLKSKFEAIAHIPSFLALKDALKGNDVPVLNVYERCGVLKLFGETKSLYLEEDERYCTSAESSSDPDSYYSY